MRDPFTISLMCPFDTPTDFAKAVSVVPDVTRYSESVCMSGMFAHRELMRKRDVRQSRREVGVCVRYHSGMKLRIKEMRAARGMTQQQLADAIGVGKSFMSEMESGKKQVNGTRLALIAKALRCAPYELIDDDSVSADVLEHIRVMQKLSEADRLAVIRHAASLADE